MSHLWDDTEVIHHSLELESILNESCIVESRHASVTDTYETWAKSFLTSTYELKKQPLSESQRSDLSSLPIALDTFWDEGYVQVGSTEVLRFDTVISETWMSIGDQQRTYPIIDEMRLLKTEDALSFLHTRIGKSVEGLFFEFEGTHGRPPGFVVNLRIIVSEYNRELEHEIYRALAEMIRNNPELLFDAHIIASKKKDVGQFLPNSYNKYIV